LGRGRGMESSTRPLQQQPGCFFSQHWNDVVQALLAPQGDATGVVVGSVAAAVRRDMQTACLDNLLCRRYSANYHHHHHLHKYVGIWKRYARSEAARAHTLRRAVTRAGRRDQTRAFRMWAAGVATLAATAAMHAHTLSATLTFARLVTSRRNADGERRRSKFKVWKVSVGMTKKHPHRPGSTSSSSSHVQNMLPIQNSIGMALEDLTANLGRIRQHHGDDRRSSEHALPSTRRPAGGRTPSPQTPLSSSSSSSLSRDRFAIRRHQPIPITEETSSSSSSRVPPPRSSPTQWAPKVIDSPTDTPMSMSTSTAAGASSYSQSLRSRLREPAPGGESFRSVKKGVVVPSIVGEGGGGGAGAPSNKNKKKITGGRPTQPK
jgi:hypothetical protein